MSLKKHYLLIYFLKCSTVSLRIIEVYVYVGWKMGVLLVCTDGVYCRCNIVLCVCVCVCVCVCICMCERKSERGKREKERERASERMVSEVNMMSYDRASWESACPQDWSIWRPFTATHSTGAAHTHIHTHMCMQPCRHTYTFLTTFSSQIDSTS